MERKYNKAFQGLRWLAAVMVFICHTDYWYNSNGFEILDGLGPFAVVIFFTLSGYLSQKNHSERVTSPKSSISSMGKECFHCFKKAIRSFLPIHLLTLAVAATINYKFFIATPGKAIGYLFLNLFLLHSWHPMTYGSFNSISWYLSITIFLMTISPILTWLVKKINWKAALFFLVLINAIQFAFSLLMNDCRDGFYFIYIFPPVRLLNFLAGCLIYPITKGLENYLKTFINCIVLIVCLIWGGVLLYLYIGQSNLIFFSAIWSLPAWGIIFSLACECKTGKLTQIIFANRIAVYLGNSTLEFFMIHMLLLRIVRYGFKFFNLKESIWLYLLAFLITLSGALILHAIKMYLEKKRKECTCAKAQH